MATLRLVLPARPEMASRARHAVRAYAEAQGAGRDIVANVELAVGEAVANAIVHAYRESDRPGEFSVCAMRNEDHLIVVVADGGMGLLPRADSPGLGLGLPLIAQVTDALEMRTPPEGGTELSMSFRLAA
jgi:serine/threonine-protein kinase RsbW